MLEAYKVILELKEYTGAEDVWIGADEHMLYFHFMWPDTKYKFSLALTEAEASKGFDEEGWIHKIVTSALQARSEYTHMVDRKALKILGENH